MSRPLDAVEGGLVLAEVRIGGLAGLEADTAAAAAGVGITCLGRFCGAGGPRAQRVSFFLLQRVAPLWDVVSDVIVTWELWQDGATVYFSLSLLFVVLPAVVMFGMLQSSRTTERYHIAVVLFYELYVLLRLLQHTCRSRRIFRHPTKRNLVG